MSTPLNCIVKPKLLGGASKHLCDLGFQLYPLLFHVPSAPTFPHPSAFAGATSLPGGPFLLISACWTPTLFRGQSQCHLLQEVPINPITPNPSPFALCSYGTSFMPLILFYHYLHVNLRQPLLVAW